MPIFGSGSTVVRSSSSADAFPRPPSRILPLSKGGDLVIDFLQTIDGINTDYALGVTVTLQVDAEPPIVAPGVISGYHAVCRVEFEVADTVPDNTQWRCIVGYPTIPTTEVVAMNGVTSRADA